MLTLCPECNLQISDKAIQCPHCGYPIGKTAIQKNRNPTGKKHMKLPNGFGSITEIKNKNLRNRFRVRITVGKTQEGKPIVKLLKPKAFFKTYNEAYEALVKYHENPYDLDKFISVKELYEKWSKNYFKTLKTMSSVRTITAAWAYCSSVYSMPVKELKARHIKGCIEDGYILDKDGKKKFPGDSTKGRIKSLFNLMLDYAVEHEVVQTNYARTFELSRDLKVQMETNKNAHIPFSDEEMKRLWENLYKIDFIDVLLIQCYTGWRPQELGLIRLKNVDLEKKIMVGGMKTRAGTDRTVPIHHKILDLVVKRYDEAQSIGSDRLFNCCDTSRHNNYFMTYDKYRHRFEKIKVALNLNEAHRAHDGRAHFITIAKKYEVDEYAIKYIVGHEIADLTERVYTQRNIEWLKTEIEKIK